MDKTLKSAWKAFRVGDPISNKDLLAMYRQVQEALPYLEARLPEFYLAFAETNRDLNTIKGYIEARGLKV
jgi:hypothetical protein